MAGRALTRPAALYLYTLSRHPRQLWTCLCPAFSLPCITACRREAYTCWNQASGARVNNYGSRIDLILAADAPSCQPGQGARAHISFCDISPEWQGSDHAPVWADLTAHIPLCRAPMLPRLASKNLFTGAPLHWHSRTC